MTEILSPEESEKVNLLTDEELMRLPGRLKRVQCTNRNENIELIGQELSSWRGSWVRTLVETAFSLLAAIDKTTGERDELKGELKNANDFTGQLMDERDELKRKVEVKKKENILLCKSKEHHFKVAEDFEAENEKLKEENANLKDDIKRWNINPTPQ